MTRSLTSRIAEVVPAIGWLRVYQPRWLRADLVAGVTLAAYLIPTGIGDASLVILIVALYLSGLLPRHRSRGGHGGRRTPRRTARDIARARNRLPPCRDPL